MQIRQAKQKDSGIIVRINQALDAGIKNQFWCTREWINDEIKQGNYFVATAGGNSTRIGAINIHLEGEDFLPNEAELISLAVLEKHRGKGAGSSLVK